MATTVCWHGTRAEWQDLTSAIDHTCKDGSAPYTCTFGSTGGLLTECLLHQALMTDQKYLDHMVYGRRLRQTLLEEEGLVTTEPLQAVA